MIWELGVDKGQWRQAVPGAGIQKGFVVASFPKIF